MQSQLPAKFNVDVDKLKSIQNGIEDDIKTLLQNPELIQTMRVVKDLRKTQLNAIIARISAARVYTQYVSMVEKSRSGRKRSNR